MLPRPRFEAGRLSLHGLDVIEDAEVGLGLAERGVTLVQLTILIMRRREHRRAMLDRLVALSLVAIERRERDQRGVVHLHANREPPQLLPAQTQMLEAISGALAESRSPWIATITVPAADPIQLAILRKTIAEKGQVLLSGIKAANPRQKRSVKTLSVFIGMADALDALPPRAPAGARQRQRGKK